jgi:hypothetical protein
MKKRRVPMQLIVALGILLVGAALLGGEYLLVKWYPAYRQHVADTTLKLLPYRNDGLGIEMQIAAGIYGKVESFLGGIRIYRPELFGTGPSVTITSQPNPDGAAAFSPQIMAQWEAMGADQGIPRYEFQRAQINGRDAALIWQLRGNAMLMTAHIISADRIIQADCTPGVEDETLYLQACDETLHSIKLAGPLPPPSGPPTLENVAPKH